VPIKRVNQAYTIVTSTVVDMKGVTVPAIDDSYFARSEDAAAAEGEDEFFAGASKAPEVSEQRKSDQAALDKSLLKSIDKVEMLKAYLAVSFSLKKGDKPHLMAF